MIEVFKFGGASIKNAEGVKNLAKIVKLQGDKKLLIVVSAMAQTTNALERLTEAYFNHKIELHTIFDEVKSFHEDILNELFSDKDHPVYDEIANAFIEIDWMLEDGPHPDYDFNYDQIVSIGEMVSSKIVSAYLNQVHLNTKWIDARGYIHTDNTYRDGQVEWLKTCQAVKSQIPSLLDKQYIVTQGFIGGTSENYTTTLGREGSDYTAAVFAACLQAASVTTWKDVPGVMNADPKLFPDAEKYDELSYSEALKMICYGATIIHPKTIKPLQNANIPLWVKSFSAPEETGTVIKEPATLRLNKPVIIVKNNQVLVSFFTGDSSLITENHLSRILRALADANIKTNLSQISALNFSVCFDRDEGRFRKLSENLQNEFKIKYNTSVDLITIRHFEKGLIEKLSKNRIVLVEQLSRNMAQLVLK